jgi:GNAT superfamily N-acetyltransferase
VVCCSPINPDQYIPFPTVVQSDGYSPEALQATAELIFGQNTQLVQGGSILPPLRTPQVWKVDLYSEARDAAEVHNLWHECVSPQFALDQQTFARLLDREGWAKHYIVRDPHQGQILGFSATYFNYVDREGEKLVASMACILTHPAHRRIGIGLSLHTHAIAQLRKIRGIVRLQLGSAFPRLLYGPLFEMSADEHMTWIRRRGWQVSNSAVRDLILDCRDWPASSSLPTTNNITFRPCLPQEMVQVLELVDKTAVRLGRTGWFDQYGQLMDTANVKDVLVGVESNTIVAAGLTFTPGGNQISQNIPWPAQIGNDVGGITCISVHGKSTFTCSFHCFSCTIRPKIIATCTSVRSS